MFSNCGNSFCQFFKKLFHIKNRRIGSYNIVTGKNSIINSNDLNKYLFADECESCKNKNTKKKKTLNHIEFTKNEDLGVYEPPIVVGSCDSFQSVNSDGDTDSDSDSDLESNEEVVNINKNKIDISML
jgi:hypothetical protein